MDLLRLYVLFPNSDHLMFSREFTFRLFISYAYICSWMHVQGRHLKETVLWGNITYGLKREKKKFELRGLQSTPDNSNLQGKWKNVRVIGSSSYREFEENSREKGKKQ